MSNGEESNIPSIIPSSAYRKNRVIEQDIAFKNQITAEAAKQVRVDNQVETVCRTCKNLLDESQYYGASPYQKETGEFFFCSAAQKILEEGVKIKNPTTGKYKIKSRSKTHITPNGYYYVDEPESKFDRCAYINKGKCETYEKNKKIKRDLNLIVVPFKKLYYRFLILLRL